MNKGSSTPGIDINEVDLIGTYVPRQCGIATFTKDLRDSLATIVGDDKVGVMAIDDDPSPFHYPEDVSFQVRQHDQGDYRTAAELMNINQADAAIVQHEFGIFGGADGRLLLHSLRPMRMPSILTLHTVLNEPSESQAAVMNELKELGDRLVVMTNKGKQFLREIYRIPDEKIRVIPHGIPDIPFVDSSFHKDQFGFEGRTVILTFGLLSPGKGIEVVIEALPNVVKENPEVLYVVLGATHPNVLKTQGDAYRESLLQRVQALGLQDHVVFRNRFVSKEELLGYIGSCDVYVTPYHNEAQITSGTLAYAMGAG
ncbi:MAG: glycosyltransferase family 4 protein, partial [Fimbriimonadaceae bacterium]